MDRVATKEYESPADETTDHPEQLARVPGNLTRFFARYSAEADTGADADGLRYAHGLLLAADGRDQLAVAAAVVVLRPLAERPVAAPLAADARVHLAQCLLLLDPSLETTTAAELETMLRESLQGDVDPELAQHATKLLAHVRLARRENDPEDGELLAMLAMCVMSAEDINSPILRCSSLDSDVGNDLTSHDTTPAPVSLLDALHKADAAAIVANPQ